MKTRNSAAGRAQIFSLLFFIATFVPRPASGSALDTIGVTLLRSATTNLEGTGIRVAHAEAGYPTFEVNPAAVGQPVSLFTYYSTNGTSTDFPNSVGAESGHANGVGGNFYGRSGGVATNVAHVDNYDADYFINTYIMPTLPASFPGLIANQSFIFSDPRYDTNLPLRVSEQIAIDSAYDDYAAQHGTLFCSGAGNGGTVYAPATCYNGLGVGVSDTTNSSVGPTLDNGRAKPDISAPGGATSFSTPFVSGAAAVLMQAALRGDGGSDTNSAADMRTLKALLLNGALKTTNWTHTSSYPLDAHYGAGVLNVFNSYMQLAGGKYGAVEQTSVTLGNPHPPGANTTNVSARSGWDFDSLSSSPPNKDRLNHYYFSLTNAPGNASFTGTATLTWNRQQAKTTVNDLDLFLYDTATGNLIAESVSGVDNVELLYVTGLPPGRYDLQVLKYGGTVANGNVTTSETYALAWEFFTLPLDIALTSTNVVLTWPIYPTGFALESTTSLTLPAWTTVNATPVVTNGTNRVTLNATNAARFFRLRRP